MPRTLTLLLAAATVGALALACSDDKTSSSSGGSSSSSGGSSSSSGGSSSGDGGASSGDGGGSSSGGDGGGSSSSGDGGGSSSGDGGDASSPLTLTSTAFTTGGNIPIVYSCDGNGTSMPLAWSGGPVAAGYAVVMLDKSLAGVNNVHWVIYDLPGATTGLTATVPAGYAIVAPTTAHQTQPSFDTTFGYFPPCPPKGLGAHDYEIKVYAVNQATLGALSMSSTPQQAIAEIDARSVASATIVGKFAR